MNFPSRRERRELAKKMGLVKKNEGYVQWLQRTRRAKELGDRINLEHLKENINKNNSDVKIFPSETEEWRPTGEIYTEPSNLLQSETLTQIDASNNNQHP